MEENFNLKGAVVLIADDQVPEARMAQNARHFKADAAMPTYACCFVTPTLCVLAGGGGSSKTGVKNKLVFDCLCSPTRVLTRAASLTGHGRSQL
jgi:hypothetical protein